MKWYKEDGGVCSGSSTKSAVSLACSLGALALKLFGVRRIHEAGAASREAVVLYRRLLILRPDDMGLLSLAATEFHRSGGYLASLTNYQEACRMDAESVASWRLLWKRSPGTITIQSISALSHYGRNLSRLHRHVEAVAIRQEVVSMLLKLSGPTPLRFAPDLALALQNLAGSFSTVNKHMEASIAWGETVTIFTLLFNNDTETYGDALGWAMERHIHELVILRRVNEALEACQILIAARRVLRASGSYTRSAPLAAALSRYGEQLLDIAQPKAACTALQEAVELLRDLCRRSVETYGIKLFEGAGTLEQGSRELGQSSVCTRSRT